MASKKQTDFSIDLRLSVSWETQYNPARTETKTRHGKGQSYRKLQAIEPKERLGCRLKLFEVNLGCESGCCPTTSRAVSTTGFSQARIRKSYTSVISTAPLHRETSNFRGKGRMTWSDCVVIASEALASAYAHRNTRAHMTVVKKKNK